MKRSFWAVATLAVVVSIAVKAIPSLVESRYNKVRVPPPYSFSAETQSLYPTLLIADLHADSLLWGRDLLIKSSIGQLDVPRLQQASVAFQVLTVVSTIPRKLNIERNADTSDLVRYLAMAEGWPPLTWSSPKGRALYQARRLEKFAARSHGQLVLLRSQEDLRKFLQSRHAHQVSAILGAEGAQPLEGRLQSLDELYAAGFRLMSPTHFTDTAVGGSASGLRKGGLTEFGRNWVRAMESKHMLIDLAHASPATVEDVTAIATRPVVVSHTGVKGTCNNNRNLSDNELRAVARTGGLIGIGYWETAVCGKDASAISRAVRYATRIVGTEHVSLGSDFDGGTTMPFDVTGLPLITGALRKDGFSESEIRLIMGENVIRLLTDVLPN